MAITIEMGLSGNWLNTYKYCGGINETARRKAKIDEGREGQIGMPVTKLEGLKSWRMGKPKPLGKARMRPIERGIKANPYPAVELPPKRAPQTPKESRKRSMGGGGK
jgi:hypothetical protein